MAVQGGYGAGHGNGGIFQGGVWLGGTLNTVITVLISVVALVFLKPLMRVLNVPETVFEEAYDYIVVIVAGMIATILYYGDTLIVAHTAARKIIGILMMPLSSIATANSTFVSQNFGARKYGRIEKSIRKGMGMEVLWGMFSAAMRFASSRIQKMQK